VAGTSSCPVFMAEALLRGPERDVDAVERADQLTSRLRVRWWDVMPYSIRNAATAARPPGLLSRSVTPRIMARGAHAGHRPAGRAEVGGVSRSTLAGKIDAVLKLSVVASVLLASSSVGYYYLVQLPHQGAQFEPERVLERFRGAAKKRAEQELLLFEQQASERRAAEQQAAEERQALEKANRYQACLSRATDNYNASRLAACNWPREKILKDRNNCIELGFSEKVCAMAHVVREASPNCTLPGAVALSLDADVEKARDRCLQED